MDNLKRTYRDIGANVRKAVRGVDGTDLQDRVGNAGDEVRKGLGNLGDDVVKAGRGPKGHRGGPASTPERPM